ncbi:hypothetical protein GCM10009808_12280 [Microbacterium sediminicola]|uniref:Regulatory protein RecX n=1 Tax=Microbacterium sediminicola TaxID=415210 RepID=A0ABN2I0U7_9MICO
MTIDRESDELAPVIPLFGGSSPDSGTTDDRAGIRDRAFDRLARKLGRKGLSLAEAREFLSDEGVPREDIDVIVDEMHARRWLDDDVLAEQIVHSCVSRRNDGRRAIAAALAKRRIDRETAARALSDLPDDDEERAHVFARSKVGALSRLDRDVAVRRLVGQLQRRGYPPSVSVSVAVAVLAEAEASRGL